MKLTDAALFTSGDKCTVELEFDGVSDLPDPRADPTGMISWLMMHLLSQLGEDRPSGSFSGHSRRRAVLTVQADMPDAPRFSEVIYQGDIARSTIACQVIAPSGELIQVHIPFRFSVTPIG